MAKDPAFLFYPNDYIGGTMGMTFEEKGAYMELLMMQFNRGHMTEHMIGQTVGQLWVNIKDKFAQDQNGLWYNKRLDEEKEKRQNYTQSRINNKNGKNQYSKKEKNNSVKSSKNKGHMTSHMEDVNENENVIKNIDVIFPFNSEIFEKYWNYWKEYKLKEHKFKYKSSLSEQAAAKKLSELAGGDETTALKIIEQSIAQGWSGFFELKANNSRSNDMDSYRQELINRMS